MVLELVSYVARSLFISIRFQAGGFASRAAKPACRPAIFTRRPDRSLFICFVISIGLGSRQEVFASRAANPTRPPKHRISQGFFASRAANPTCRLTFLHVGQTYPTHRLEPRATSSLFLLERGPQTLLLGEINHLGQSDSRNDSCCGRTQGTGTPPFRQPGNRRNSHRNPLAKTSTLLEPSTKCHAAVD